MIGAILGDMIGSRFEHHNIKTREFELFTRGSRVTDDSIMTLAVAKALLECNGDDTDLAAEAVKWMQTLGQRYPKAGYGGKFRRWLTEENPQPYNSFGNGAAMRVSPCAYFAKDMEQAIELSRTVTAVSHDHPEGIRGAEAVTVAVYLALHGSSKDEIREAIIRDHYPMNFALDEIRDSYQFDSSCQGSVPQAIEAFLESVDFEDAIRNAISIGGDSDTIAAMTGSIAGAYYGVPDDLSKKARKRLKPDLAEILMEFEAKIKE